MAATASPRATLAAWLLVLLFTVPAGTAEDPPSSVQHIDLEERARASLSVVRLRIEPASGAPAGMCRRLGPDDLVAEVQGRELTGTRYLRLDRVRTPTLHALVLDNSASMIDSFEQAKIAATEYVEQLDPERERGLVMTFDESVINHQPPTRDLARLAQTIAGLRTGSRTSLLDAVYYAARELDAHRERPVLILLSDGADTSSYHTPRDIEEQIRSRPDLTVFAIGLGLQTGDGDKRTRELLRRIAAESHGGFFEVTRDQPDSQMFSRIRDILDSEAILTVVHPQAPAGALKIQVRSRDSNCAVTVLHTLSDESGERHAIPRHYPEPPLTFEAQLDPTRFGALKRGAEQGVDAACPARAVDRGAWFLEAGPQGESGCVPDITKDHGRLFTPPSTVAQNVRLRLTARPFEVPIIPFAMLPRRPEEALDLLAQQVLGMKDSGALPPAWVGPWGAQASPFEDYPYLVHGATFLEMRPVLARAAFLYPDYRTWALARIAAEAEVDTGLLVERYRRAFPEEPATVVETAARLSVEGRSIAARVDEPSVLDLQPFLAAWLGDIPAHDLFLRWERRRIDRAIAGEPPSAIDERFVEAWKALRQVLFAPTWARVLTLLVPVRDDACDCVGFWRVELPRPGWMVARASGLTADRDTTGDFLDLVPDIPAGWLAFERVAGETPGLIESLRERVFRAVDLKYTLRGPATLRDPQNAYAEYGVEIVLARNAGNGGGEELFVLRPELRRPSDAGAVEPEYVDLTIESSDGAVPAELADGLRAAGRRILGVEEIAEATTQVDAPLPSPPGPAVSRVEGPVEHATASAVLVPVVVRRGDEPVRGLTAENFELFDEGNPRSLTGVEFVDVTTRGRSANADLPPAARRHLVFLFDLTFSEPGAVARARTAVIEALGRLHDTDLVAVAVYTADRGLGLVLDFTADRAELKRAVESVGPLATERSSDVGPGGEADLRGASGFTERDSGEGAEIGAGAGRDAAREHFESIQSEMVSSARRDQAARVESLYRDLGSMAQWLYRVPGRKQVVFLSEGFDSSLVFASADSAEQRSDSESVQAGAIWEVESQRRFGDVEIQSALDTALGEFRRADSPIQAIHIAAPGSAGERVGEDGLNAMARGTGGEMYRASSDIEASLDRVLERTGTFYVLVFQPSDLRPDGQFHKLRVKLKDVPRGTRAVHRPGYFAPPPPRKD